MIESAEEFIALRTSTDPAQYARATMEPAADAVWHDLITNHPEMRTWVVHNKTVPSSILELLAVDGDPRVRSAVARKRKATWDVLARLASDVDEGVRHAVAMNRSTAPDILQRLVDDPWETVAEAARRRLGASAGTT